MKEIWKDIKGHEGYYQVSNLGRVKSLSRVVPMIDGRKYRVSEKFLSTKQNTNKRNGHLQVTLCESGDKGVVYHYPMVQHLVLNTFVGPCPSKMEARHIDGNHGNNRLDNLQWDRQPAEMIKRRADKTRGQKRTPAQNKRSSDSHKIAMNRPEVKEKLRQGTIRFWADPKNKEQCKNIVKKIIQSNRARPNTLETRILKILDKKFPGLWKYTGDGTLILGRKNPDFVCSDLSLIIEAFGSYWHVPKDETMRRSYFKKYGYRTLVVWGGESVQSFVRRVKGFIDRAKKARCSQ